MNLIWFRYPRSLGSLEELHHDLWRASGKGNFEKVDQFLSLGVPPDVHGHGSEFGKIAGKKILIKSAEATGDLIGSKIGDKIT